MTLSLPGRCDLAERQSATERSCVQLIAGCFPSPAPGSRTIWASSDVTLSSFSEPVNELTKTLLEILIHKDACALKSLHCGMLKEL